MAKVNIAQFVKEVRQEGSKVTWPTRRETALSTVMVFIMVIISALFFFLVDLVLQSGIELIIG